tara:strand:+ start:1146 stop:1334 length:189 start_codon:yes stop_codon:yes gene_type:complete
MSEAFKTKSGLMARLTISALNQISEDDSNWKEPIVHKAILISGISIMIECIQFIEDDLIEYS